MTWIVKTIVCMWTWREKRRMGWIGRSGLTYIYYHVLNRQLVASCCIAQEAQLSALRWHRGMGWRCVYTHTHTQLIHFVVQQKLTQHCKAIILQLKKKRKPLFETLRTLRSRTSLYSSLSCKAPSYIEESQEMLLYKYFFLSKRNNFLDSTAQTIFWFLPLCFVCCREHSGNWQLLAVHSF